MPRRFDAVISDIDGCLAPESSAPIDAAALVQIAEHNRLAQTAMDRPVVTLCSGRPEPFVEAMARFMFNHSVPCIAENGVWLYHPDRNGYDRDPSITDADLLAVAEAQAWVERELASKGVRIQPGKSGSVSLYHADTEYLRSLEPMVKAEFEKRRWPFRVSMTWLYINCDLQHISKGTAIDRLIAQTGLKRERLAGIGDTAGDALIADRVAFFACPANAATAIKTRAHYISTYAEAKGVLDILERLR